MSGKEHDDGLDASFIISQAKSRNRPLHPYTPEKRRRHRLYRNRPARPPPRRLRKRRDAAEEGKARITSVFYPERPLQYPKRQTVYIRKEFHERITRIVQVIGKNELSLYSYLDNVLEQHFATYQEEISELYKKRNSDIFSYEPNIFTIH